MAASIRRVALIVSLASSALIVLGYRESTAEVPEDKSPAVPTGSKNASAGKPVVRTDVWGDPLPPQAVARLGSLRLYHGGAVHRVILSPDGKWVVSTNRDGNRLWEAATGREQPFREELRQAAIFATRDKLVAVANQNGDLQLWDIAFSKKFGILLPAAKVGPLWKTLHLFWAGEDFFSPLLLAPDGRTLVLCNPGAGGKPALRFCDVLSGQVEEPIALKLDDGGIEIRMAFSADSKTLVVQCNDAAFSVWDTIRRTEKIVSRSSANDYGGEIALSPDGIILATAPRKDKRVRLWDTRTLQELPPLLKQPKELVKAVSFSADGKQLAVSYSSWTGGGGDVHLWDLASRTQVRKFQGKTRSLSLAFSADGKYLAAGDGGGITFWDIATGKPRHDFGHTYTIRSICFSPDGRRIVSGAPYTDKIIRIWDPLTGKEMTKLRGHTGGIEKVAYAPDGKVIASASEDGTVRLWDAETDREVRRLESKDGQVYGMAFAPDGKTLASGGAGCAVHFWDVAAGRKLRSVAIPGGFLMNLALSPDGKWLATQDRDEKGIQLWDAAIGEQIRRLGRQETHWNNLAFSPDSRMLASGSDDGIVRLWDLPGGDECRTFTVLLKPGQSNPAASIAFSPDGHSLAVGYMDGTVRVWELSSGGERLRFEGHRSGITSLDYSPDGSLLASGGNEDLIIMIWDVTGQWTTHQPRKDHLHPEEGNALWDDLADADASKAYRTMQTLFAAGAQAVSLLKQHLHPAAAIDARRIDQLIAELDSNQFEVRETAEKELGKMGDDAEPALRKVLAGKPSAEQRRRVKQLLQEIDDAGSSGRLRGVRAVEVLERLGTTDTRRLLKMLAEGDRNARLTREATAALQRLQRKELADKAEPRP